ncbi:hypothetical protein STEG23_023189 [Scotinomys teguina]
MKVNRSSGPLDKYGKDICKGVIKGFVMTSPKVSQVFPKFNDGYPSTTQKTIHGKGYMRIATEVGMLQSQGMEWTSEADSVIINLGDLTRLTAIQKIVYPWAGFVVQAGFELLNLLSQPSESWNNRKFYILMQIKDIVVILHCTFLPLIKVFDEIED